MKEEEQEDEEVVTDGKLKLNKTADMESQNTSSTVTGKLKKRVTKKVNSLTAQQFEHHDKIFLLFTEN